MATRDKRPTTETPFSFGKTAREQDFTDRKEETARLVSNFKPLAHTILISPRRWGKSSLVAKAASVAEQKNTDLRTCASDLFNVQKEEDFYAQLTQCVPKATASKWEEIIGSVKKFFASLVSKTSLSNDPNQDISVEFDWKEAKQKPDEISDLAERTRPFEFFCTFEPESHNKPIQPAYK